ncbi:hypothetical protein QR680_019318 [Steinernema hermaphroditum]|uniref:Uncharacterized protein n=1 Tax=Steinernema hermaphroditum TaxID=289476 RepID=A0AA39GMY8_9BILA|nr:hypothetical protein QR680_019318 [Steinernema hermaphroditum]
MIRIRNYSCPITTETNAFPADSIYLSESTCITRNLPKRHTTTPYLSVFFWHGTRVERDDPISGHQKDKELILEVEQMVEHSERSGVSSSAQLASTRF